MGVGHGLRRSPGEDFASLAERKQVLAATGFDGNVEHVAALQHQLAEQLKAELWVRPNVSLLPAGTLPVTEGKARRVIDKRSL